MSVKLNDRIPIPPRNAEIKNLICEFCIVGCGYKAYKWAVGVEGGRKPQQNAIGEDFSKQIPANGNWASPNMVNVIEENGSRHNLMVIPDKKCIVNEGLNSVRGGLLASTLFSATGDTNDRLKEPMIYRGRKLYETTWEESTGLLSKLIARILEKDTPNDIAFAAFDHGGGGGGYENTWGTGKLFFSAIKTISARIHNRPAYNSEVHATREMGIGELNSSYYDAELADVIVQIGANPVVCQTNLFFAHMVKNLYGQSAKNKKIEYERGETVQRGKMIIIDPRISESVKTAKKIAGDNVLHLQLKPGTDVTLMNTLVTYIVENNWHAKHFIKKHTEGFEGMYKRNRISIEEGSRITGVPVSKLKKAAIWLAKPKKSGHRPRNWIGYEKGIIWGIKNYQNVASIVNLALVTQSVGRAGTFVGRVGGHQEGYARPPYGGPPRWNLPVIDEHIKSGDYKLFFMWGCDSTITSIDAEGLRRSLARRSEIVKRVMDRYEGKDLDFLADKIYEAVRDYGGLFIVDVDIYPRPKQKYAHIVFPAATTMEMNLTSMNGERRIRISEKIVEPPGSSKPDCLIAAAIANAVKTEFERRGRTDLANRFNGFNWKTEEDAFNDGFRKAGKEDIDSQGGPTGYIATYDRLRKAGNNGVQLPIKRYRNGRLIGTRMLYTDYKFGTKSGKAKFLPTPQPDLPTQIEKMMGRHKYWINNGRLNLMWQSNYHTGRMKFTSERWPMAPIFLNPKDMKNIGVADGDLVLLWNDYGSVRAIAYTDDGVRPGEPFMAFGFPNSPMNNLVTDFVDPDTKIPYYKGTVASIKRIGRDKSLIKQMSFKPLV